MEDHKKVTSRNGFALLQRDVGLVGIDSTGVVPGNRVTTKDTKVSVVSKLRRRNTQIGQLLPGSVTLRDETLEKSSVIVPRAAGCVSALSRADGEAPSLLELSGWVGDTMV